MKSGLENLVGRYREVGDDKEEYIKALVATRGSEDLDIFRRFMTGTMIAHLNRDISSYLESIGKVASGRLLH